MKIYLIRHAKPNVSTKFFVTSKDLKQWVTKYDNADIILNEEKSLSLKKQLNKNIFCVSSTRIRAIKTAESLGFGGSVIKDGDFSEIELPILDLGRIILPLPIWFIILRSLWFFKFPFNIETYEQTCERARIAAGKLEEFARIYKEVALFGHGFFNRLLVQALTKRNWRCTGKKDMSHLGISTLKKKINIQK